MSLVPFRCWCLLGLQDIDTHDRALEEREAKLAAIQAQLNAKEEEVAAKAAAVADADKRHKVRTSPQAIGLSVSNRYKTTLKCVPGWLVSKHCVSHCVHCLLLPEHQACTTGLC